MRTLSTAAILALAATLSACAGGPDHRGLNSAHQPVVSRTDYVFDVRTEGAGLSYAEEARLADWFATLDVGYGDRIAIDDPDPYGSAERRAEVARIAGRYGILLADRPPVTQGQIAPGTMRVVVSRMSAEVPGCPDWEGGLVNYTGSAMPNYGCATNQNTAIMVANPEDLVRGQPGDAAGDPRVATRAIGVYRDTPPTGADGLDEVQTTGEN